jgi:hypothetical protein
MAGQLTNIPGYGPMVDGKGQPNGTWYAFFLSLANALTGGNTSGIVVSGNNFGPASANTFLSGPSGGGATKPAFRVLQSGDLASVAGLIPGITLNPGTAPAGDVGEFISDSVTSPVALTSGAAADIASVALSAGDWDVWASFGTVVTSASQTLIAAWINTMSATELPPPNGGAFLSRGISAGETTDQFAPVGMMQLSVSVPTTVFLSANVSFTGTSIGGVGFIGARRRR